MTYHGRRFLLCFRLSCASCYMLRERIMYVRHAATRRKLSTPALPRKPKTKTTPSVCTKTPLYINMHRMPQNKTKNHARHASNPPPPARFRPQFPPPGRPCLPPTLSHARTIRTHAGVSFTGALAGRFSLRRARSLGSAWPTSWTACPTADSAPTAALGRRPGPAAPPRWRRRSRGYTATRPPPPLAAA